MGLVEASMPTLTGIPFRGSAPGAREQEVSPST